MTFARIASAATLSCVLNAFVFDDSQAQLDNARTVSEYLDSQVSETLVPGLVALVVDSDDVLYEHAAGLRNVASKEDMTPDTIFRLASMTKPIAATVIMMLVDEGKLGLDEPVARYLPSLAGLSVIERFDITTGEFDARPAANEITIRQLLSHSSGLVYPVFSNVFSAIPDPDDARYPLDNMLLYDPGSSWSYAGGIALVGTIAERIEGVGLDTLMRDLIFEPLGMHETSFIVRSQDLDRVATVHNLVREGNLQDVPNGVDIRSDVSGDGGLHSTARDYAKFIQLILNDGIAPDGRRLLSRNVIAELTRNQLGMRTVELMDEPNPLFSRSFPLGVGRDGFGLGFQVTGEHSSDSMRAPGSLSWAGIFNTEFWIDPERGVGGVLLMQYLPFYHPDSIETLQGFEALVYQGL